jgi:large subunit ribosomal protein L20
MRVKRGFKNHRRHKKYLKQAKGFRGRRKNCYSIAKRAVENAMKHAYRGRKNEKREMRSLWIIRINAASRAAGMSYSKFVMGLKKAHISVDRKILAELALNDSPAFNQFVEKARAAL